MHTIIPQKKKKKKNIYIYIYHEIFLNFKYIKLLLAALLKVSIAEGAGWLILENMVLYLQVLG